MVRRVNLMLPASLTDPSPALLCTGRILLCSCVPWVGQAKTGSTAKRTAAGAGIRASPAYFSNRYFFGVRPLASLKTLEK